MIQVPKCFEYEYALICNGLPSSIVNGLSLEDHDPVDLDLAKKQHSEYLKYLKESGLKLIEIEPQEQYPDCVFVEDTAIALGNKIFISNPGADSRRGETIAVEKKFREYSSELGLEIYCVSNKDEAFIDGGDVCFTGHEFFVGLSKRTNSKGVEEMQKAFEGVPVHTCVVHEGLHLKSSLSMMGVDTILIGTSDAAQSVRKQMEEKTLFKNTYKFVEVDEDATGSANVLFYNEKLVLSESFKHLYNAKSEFQQGKSKWLENSEFKKIDGCLTCRSVFFNKEN